MVRASTAWEDGSATYYSASAYVADGVARRLERRGLWRAAECVVAWSITHERWRKDTGRAEWAGGGSGA